VSQHQEYLLAPKMFEFEENLALRFVCMQHFKKFALHFTALYFAVVERKCYRTKQKSFLSETIRDGSLIYTFSARRKLDKINYYCRHIEVYDNVNKAFDFSWVFPQDVCQSTFEAL